MADSNIATEQMLYTEADLEASMDRIETINFHEEKDIMGIRFWAYNAGHVLGAAMFMLEIAGVKVGARRIVMCVQMRDFLLLDTVHRGLFTAGGSASNGGRNPHYQAGCFNYSECPKGIFAPINARGL